MSTTLPFQCSHEGCANPTASDWCPAHLLMEASFLRDGDAGSDADDEAQGGFYGFDGQWR